MLSPFRPARGSEPPILVGREAEIAALAVSMRMTESRGAAQPVVITGLRGMGKTVLLRRAIRDAGPAGIVLAAEKDIVYAPATGLIEFRLPLTDQFVLRNEASLEARFPD